MLVVDLLHEFELGVWKSLFTQLVRLLYAAGKERSETLVAELDSRSVCNYFVFNRVIQVLPTIDIVKSRHLAAVPYEHFRKTLQK